MATLTCRRCHQPIDGTALMVAHGVGGHRWIAVHPPKDDPENPNVVIFGTGCDSPYDRLDFGLVENWGPCQGCGRTLYRTSRHLPHYCSNDCRRESILRRRRERRALEPRACEECGETFTPARRDTRYCGTRCRVAAHRRRAADAQRGSFAKLRDELATGGRF